MKARVLPILNAVGCLALTTLVIVQWKREHQSGIAAAGLRKELAASRAETVEEVKRCTALERDVALLKESIEATQQAAEQSGRALEEKEQLATSLQTELTTARGQVVAWQEAIKQRDERITTLTDQLNQTRKRLEEAIARIREAENR